MIDTKKSVRFCNRRKNQRFTVPLTIEYNIPPGQKLCGKTVADNVSGEGLSFCINKRIAKKDKIKLKIYFPDNLKPVGAIGEVRWCRERSGKNKGEKLYDIGLRYVKIQSDKEKFAFMFCEMMLNYFILRDKSV